MKTNSWNLEDDFWILVNHMTHSNQETRYHVRKGYEEKVIMIEWKNLLIWEDLCQEILVYEGHFCNWRDISLLLYNKTCQQQWKI